MVDSNNTIAESTGGSLHVSPLCGPLKGTFYPPGDRCISHRALILSAIARGPTRLLGTLESPVIVATRRVLAQLGVSFITDDEGWLVVSRRSDRLSGPEIELDCGNSQGTLWLMTGLLAGLELTATLGGGAELLRQDCGELITQLRAMGATLECLGHPDRPPLRISGHRLTAVDADIPPAAFLLKDALLLAALFANGVTRLSGAVNGNDHLERLLKLMGVSVRRSGITLTVKGLQNIHPREIMIPGDATATSPLVIAATLTAASDVTVRQVGANPGRMGLIKTLNRIGANITRERDWQFGSEPVTNLRIRHASALEPFNIAPNLSPFLLDEFPLLALLATQIEGTSHLRNGHQAVAGVPNIQQLTAQVLRQYGADIEDAVDGFIVHGPTPLIGNEIQCAGNLSLSLLALTAALVAEGDSMLHAAGVLGETYPNLLADINQLSNPQPAAIL